MSVVNFLKHLFNLYSPSKDLYYQSKTAVKKFPYWEDLIEKDLDDLGWRFSARILSEETGAPCRIDIFRPSDGSVIKFEPRVDADGGVYWTNIQDRVYELPVYYAVERFKKFLDKCTASKNWEALDKKLLEMS